MNLVLLCRSAVVKESAGKLFTGQESRREAVSMTGNKRKRRTVEVKVLKVLKVLITITICGELG